MASRAEQPIREFDQIHRELEQVVARLKDCRDPKSRRDLLLTLRVLRLEADAVTAAMDQAVTHLKLVPHRNIDPSPKAN